MFRTLLKRFTERQGKKRPQPSTPGSLLQEALNVRTLSRTDLATKTGWSLTEVEELLKDQKEWTPEVATTLERVLGIEASFWVQIGRDYLESKFRMSPEAQHEFVKRFSQGSYSLAQGHYLTEEDLQTEREKRLNYQYKLERKL